MAYKVFLFENVHWIYCSDVTFEDGVYHGEVINGNWHLMYDTTLEEWTACKSRKHADSLVAVSSGKSRLVWACDPFKALWDYNTVIEDALKRYVAGEPANYELKPDPVYKDEEDEGAF